MQTEKTQYRTSIRQAHNLGTSPMPFHNATTAPAPSPKRTTVKRAKKPAPVSIPLKRVEYATPQHSGLLYNGALVDPAWEKEYATKHPPSTIATAPSKSVTETIEGLLAPIADASFNPALILSQSDGGAKVASPRDGFSVEVMEGFDLILEAATRLINDLHHGDTSMQAIGATRDGSDGDYFLEASALERCLSSDLKLAMVQFRIAARGVATALEGDSGQDALSDIKSAAAAEIMEEPDVYFDTETMLDIGLSGYDTMDKEELAHELLFECDPRYKRP